MSVTITFECHYSLISANGTEVKRVESVFIFVPSLARPVKRGFSDFVRWP